MNYNRLLIVGTALLATACMPPDVVVRPGSHFSKDSTITLVTDRQDNAIFRPELEKELLRRGFNVISDSVAQVVSQEKKTGDVKVAGSSSSEGPSEKSVAKAQGDEVTEKSTSRIMKSEFIGKFEYLYKPGDHTVSRVNFTVIELKTGVVVVSAGYERSGTNTEIAREIVKQIETALKGTK